MDEKQKEALKKKLTATLIGAVNGSEKQYITKNGYVDWGLVEKHIHRLIDEV